MIDTGARHGRWRGLLALAVYLDSMNPIPGRRRLLALAAAAGLAMLSAAAARPAPAGDEASRVARWRAERLAALTGETGWLTPIALYWLRNGENSFGRGS